MSTLKHAREPVAVGILACLLGLQAAVSETTGAPAPGLAANPAANTAPMNPELPTLFVAGDSTAARNDGNPTQGWGVPFADYFDPAKINIANRARGGRSSRTFITEGLWENLLSELKSGDLVLIQFGHNDAGAINAEPPESTRPLRARGSLPGIGDETEEIDNVLTGKHEVVRTFGWYLRSMIADVRKRGATPIVLSLTVRNFWIDGRVERGSGEYRTWSKSVADAAGAPYIDVTRIIADRYQVLGEANVAALFGTDHTHTNTAGADLNAAAVVAGLKGLRGHSFGEFLSQRGRDVEADGMGWLNLPEPANNTLPTVMIVGDSTARNGRGDGSENALWGWGEPFAALFDSAKVNVVNRAVGGTSSRTFISLGYWERALTLLNPGDILLIQFGHNDASPVNDNRRARGTLAGLGDETYAIDNMLTGGHEIVHTYGWYLRTMISAAQDRGVSPVLITPTLTNAWSDGHIGPGPGGGRYAAWTRDLASELGLPLVDLATLATPVYEKLGEDGVVALFPVDHTHTGAAGAELNARLVLQGLRALPGDPVGAWLRR